MLKTSIIIPTLNEAEHIERLVLYLLKHGGSAVKEIIVVDGGSTDHTQRLAEMAGAKVICAKDRRGRAKQLNIGAQAAQGELLYFVHADTLPPKSYMQDIQAALQQGYSIGCFRFKFNSNRSVFRLNDLFTGLDVLWVRGGDQSFFIPRSAFEALGGYDEEYVVMEDFDLLIRARKKYRFKILPKRILVSARKYDHNTWWQVQVANLTVFRMYKKGYKPQQLAEKYRTMLRIDRYE